MNISFKLMNLVKKAALFLFDYELLNDPVEENRRWEICKSNADSCYDKDSDTCKGCGCYMEIKTKMLKHINVKKRGRIEITHCPLALWGKDLGPEEYSKEKEIANYYNKIDLKEII